MIKLEPLQREFVFEDDRPFASCHASTLLPLADGTVLAAWFGGTRESADDVAIWLSLRSSATWSAPEKAADEEGLPHWNPVLFSPDGRRVILYYKVGKTIPAWETRVTESADAGATWTAPRPLIPGDQGGRGPVRNKPIVCSDGTWLAPASVETAERWDAFVDISVDEGASWTMSGWVPLPEQRELGQEKQLSSKPPVPASSFAGRGVIQPTLWESQPQHVHMLLRSTAGRIYRSDSSDGGRTWCAAYPTDLPNNNSGIDVVQTKPGHLVLVCNPIGSNWGERTPLSIFVSPDNGDTWQKAFVLEDEPGEYSYPAIVASETDRVLLTYTWRRERIAFWEFRVTES